MILIGQQSVPYQSIPRHFQPPVISEFALSDLEFLFDIQPHGFFPLVSHSCLQPAQYSEDNMEL